MDDQAAGPATRPVEPIGRTEPLPRIQRPQPGPQAGQAIILTLEDGRQVPLTNGALRIGRALDNDLVIADSRVSRYHAQIVRDGQGPMVRDLGSTNGTAVAGRVVSEYRLGDGDTLSLGGYLIGVRIGSSPRPGRR
jgi:pSer/pThr/pTyr-binding forkhead associated (FHA) protein